MAIKFLLDLLTGNMALVDVPTTTTPAPPSYAIPAFAGFILIPQ